MHRELRETMAQLDAIRHEMRTGMSIMNPGPRTRGAMDTTDPELSTRFQTQENGDNPPLPLGFPKLQPAERFLFSKRRFLWHTGDQCLDKGHLACFSSLGFALTLASGPDKNRLSEQFQSCRLPETV